MIGSTALLVTALHAAALTGKLPVVEVLLAKGALVDVSDGSDDTPLSLACRHWPTCLSGLSRCAAVSCARSLTQLAPGPRSLRARARSVRLWPRPSRHGDAAVARCLLGAGARHDSRNKSGLSPLAEALVNNAPEAASALFKAGASLQAVRGCGLARLTAV